MLTCYSPVRRSSTPKGLSARLACVKHAASVRPEPGSNSPTKTVEKNPGNNKIVTKGIQPTPKKASAGVQKILWHWHYKHPVEFSKNNHTPTTTGTNQPPSGQLPHVTCPDRPRQVPVWNFLRTIPRQARQNHLVDVLAGGSCRPAGGATLAALHPPGSCGLCYFSRSASQSQIRLDFDHSAFSSSLLC